LRVPVAAAAFLLTWSAAINVWHEDHGNFSAGQPGDPKKAARVVKVKMFEGSGKMGFDPARIGLIQGDRV
jgi:hypothetical protein